MMIKPLGYNDLKGLADHIDEKFVIVSRSGIEIKKLIGITDKSAFIFEDWTEVRIAQTLAFDLINGTSPVQLYLYRDLINLINS